MADESKHRSRRFRKSLLNISKQLDKADIKELKFLVAGLQGNPGFAELETAEHGIGIFMLLIKTESISEDNYEYLEDLLKDIGQNALIKKFHDLMKDDDLQESTTPSSPPKLPEAINETSQRQKDPNPLSSRFQEPKATALILQDHTPTSPSLHEHNPTSPPRLQEHNQTTPPRLQDPNPTSLREPNLTTPPRLQEPNTKPQRLQKHNTTLSHRLQEPNQTSLKSPEANPTTSQRSKEHNATLSQKLQDSILSSPEHNPTSPEGLQKPEPSSLQPCKHPAQPIIANSNYNQPRFTDSEHAMSTSQLPKTEKSPSDLEYVPSSSTGAIRKVVRTSDKNISTPTHQKSQSKGQSPSHQTLHQQNRNPPETRKQDTSYFKKPDTTTTSSSFHYNSLTSVDVPGLARPCVIPTGHIPNTQHRDITGPTLELISSVSSHRAGLSKKPHHNNNKMEPSLEDKHMASLHRGSSSEKPPDNDDSKMEPRPEDKRMIHGRNQFPKARDYSQDLKQPQQHSGKLHGVPGNRESPHQTSGSVKDSATAVDIETDAPEDEEIGTASNNWIVKPSEQTSLYPINVVSQDAARFQAFAPKRGETLVPYSQGITPSSFDPIHTKTSVEMPLPLYDWSKTVPYITTDNPERVTSSNGCFGPVGSDTSSYITSDPSIAKTGSPNSISPRRTIAKNQASALLNLSRYQTGSQMPDTKQQVPLSPYQQRPIRAPNEGSSYNRNQDDYIDRILELKQMVADSVAKQPQSARRVPPPADRVDEEGRRSEEKTLRKYQLELAAPAKSGDNHIICAPTGSGKTLVAATVCRYFYDRAKREGTRFKALFIVNNRHLMQQQTNAFRDSFPVGTVTTLGDTELLNTVFFVQDHAVVMITAQILVNALKKTPTPELTLGDISMIVLDECHHTTLDHPYNEIMKMYLRLKKATLGDKRRVGVSSRYLPQIIGLSASLGVGHGKDAYHHVLTLCGNIDSKNVTQVRRHVSELDKHVNSPEQDLILYVRRRHAIKRHLGDIINDIMSDIEGQLMTEWTASPPPPHTTQLYEQWVVEERKDAEVNSRRDRLVASLYLFEYNRSLMLYEDLRALDSLRHLETFMANRDVRQRMTPIEALSREYFQADHTEMKRICSEETDSHNPKLEKLAMLLKQKFTDKPNSKGIVLTRMRQGATALVEYIRTTSLLRGLPVRVSPIRLVGQGETDNFFMTESDQKMALDRFREDDSCNVLVATDIAQEGLDMPACNFVIRYNFVSNEIGTVQSKGRARAKQSECYLIVEGGSQNAVREIENRQKVINMQEAMKKLNDKSEVDRLKDITERQDEIYKDMEDKENKKTSKRWTHESSAVEILCKECNAFITTGSYMRKKGCHFTCVDPTIQERVLTVKYNKPQVYRDTQNIGNFKCANRTCGQQLGIAVYFLNGRRVITHKGYGFKVKSFLFKLPDGTKTTWKQWTKVSFKIQDM